MKYMKLFMLMVAAALFTACSDDDDFNTSSTTVEFESSTLTIKENEGLVNIPIKIEGKRNGKVRIKVSVEGTGSNPAKDYTVGEGGDYMMTTTTLTVDADTLSSSSVNLEMKVIDDDIINPDRTLAINIVSADGAQIGTNKRLDVTIENNEKSLYDLFGGKWVFSYDEPQEDGSYVTHSADITLSTLTDETSANYGKTIFANAPSFYFSSLGGEASFAWTFNYAYDESTKKGTLSLVCSKDAADKIFTTSGYTFFWQLLKKSMFGTSFTDGEIAGTWTAGDNNTISDEVVFDQNAVLVVYGGQTGNYGAFTTYTHLKLVRK